MLEYIDQVTMAGITQAAGLDLGISEGVRAATAAYLVVVLEGARADRVDEDAEAVATLLDSLGAIDVFVLPPTAGEQLIKARERAFFVAKAAGSNDIVDVVVPRAAIPGYLALAGALAAKHDSLVFGCGHAGDGNVHLTVFQPDPGIRIPLVRELLEEGMAAGGAISGEHGLGRAKAGFFLELGDPVVISLMQKVKQAFDPNGILGPGNLPGLPPDHAQSDSPGAAHPGAGGAVSAPVKGAELIISTLASNGVDVTFANPGTSEMHFVAALDTVPEMRGVLCLFEGVVTGAADGYARIVGKPAATLLHLGPGLANGLANLHNARRANSPVVNLVGDHATYHKRFDPPLESDIESLASPMSGWVRRCVAAGRPRGRCGVGPRRSMGTATACRDPHRARGLVVARGDRAISTCRKARAPRCVHAGSTRCCGRRRKGPAGTRARGLDGRGHSGATARPGRSEPCGRCDRRQAALRDVPGSARARRRNPGRRASRILRRARRHPTRRCNDPGSR